MLPQVRELGAPLSLASLPDLSAVLANDTDEAILGIVEIWWWKHAHGRGIQQTTITPLASSLGFETLLASQPFEPGNRRIVLAGSKRVITPDGSLGDNSDVLTVPTPAFSQSECFSFGNWLPQDLSEVASVQLRLDTVFLSDGRVVGPDETQMLPNPLAAWQLCRNEASRIKSDLQLRSSPSALIDYLQERAQQTHYPPRDPNFHSYALCDIF